MNKGLYIRLATQNIKNNKNTFFPFAFSSIAMIAMFYMLSVITAQIQGASFTGVESMKVILSFGQWVCAIFSCFVMLYTNGFLVKRRTKEFGLYSILGMEKRHIGKVVFWEMALTGIVSICLGILFGILFSRFMFFVLIKLIHLSTPIRFGVAWESIRLTVLLFLAVYALIFIVNAVRIHVLRPIDLLFGSKKGESEPKAKWLMALLGAVSLGVGYYIALTTQNPIDAMQRFFLAVILVIIGTYFLFVAGSIAMLKLLKKNRSFYYERKHFITVSGLMYRMTQNAMGLASICILSTAVLVVLSTTVSLYAGMNDVLRTRFPMDVSADFLYYTPDDEQGSDGSYDYSVLPEVVEEYAKANHVSILKEQAYYSFYTFGSIHPQDDNYFDLSDYTENNFMIISAVTADGYQSITGQSLNLSGDEVAIYTTVDAFNPSLPLNLNDRKYTIASVLEKAFLPEDVIASSYEFLYIVFPDLDNLVEMRDIANAALKDQSAFHLTYSYEMNISGTSEDKIAFCNGLRQIILDTGIAHVASVENIFTSVEDFYQLYGSLFFIGIFIGTLFLIITVMIIYYKQISEGYEDRERFSILQKVGMSEHEIKGTIHSQIMLVFFLPILMAVVHICFAFGIICKLLQMLNLTNVALFAGCMVGTIAVFVAVYAIVYHLTAKVYYRLVYQN